MRGMVEYVAKWDVDECWLRVGGGDPRVALEWLRYQRRSVRCGTYFFVSPHLAKLNSSEFLTITFGPDHPGHLVRTYCVR